VILIDQLKKVFIDGELEIVETALWYPKIYRKDYKIGLKTPSLVHFVARRVSQDKIARLQSTVGVDFLRK
jgi:hypothetical protein